MGSGAMWLDETLDALARQPRIGYAANGPPACDPTAIAALALLKHGRTDAARAAATFLAETQADDGSVGVRPGESEPGWPTSLAIIAWHAVGPRDAVAGSSALRGVPGAANPLQSQ